MAADKTTLADMKRKALKEEIELYQSADMNAEATKAAVQLQLLEAEQRDAKCAGGQVQGPKAVDRGLEKSTIGDTSSCMAGRRRALRPSSAPRAAPTGSTGILGPVSICDSCEMERHHDPGADGA